jgi:hypothetical protein
MKEKFTARFTQGKTSLNKSIFSFAWEITASENRQLFRRFMLPFFAESGFNAINRVQDQVGAKRLTAKTH